MGTCVFHQVTYSEGLGETERQDLSSADCYSSELVYYFKSSTGETWGTPPDWSVILSAPGHAEEQTLLLYPNPVAGELNLQFGAAVDNAVIEIYDIPGKVVYRQYVQGPWSKHKLSVIALAPGTYIVKIKTPNITLYRRIVK